MKSFFKKIISLCLAALILLIIAGCGSRASQSSSSQGASSSQTMSGMGSKTGAMASSSGMSGKDGTMGAMNTQEGEGTEETFSSGTGYPLTITDRLGNTITLTKKPEKIAVLSGTNINLFYAVGGKSICTQTISGNLIVPEEVKSLPDIGNSYRPDIEKILALSPDLVIAQYGLQDSIVPALQQSKVPVVSVRMRSYEDVQNKARLFARILGTESKAEELITSMETKKQAILSKLPANGKKVMILYMTSQDVSVKLGRSVAGGVSTLLGLTNVASSSKTESLNTETTPFSMEEVVAQNPDYILVTTMLSDESTAPAMMEKKFGSDPVWKGLQAVKDKHVVFLPQRYFLNNAGPDYMNAAQFMAEAVYPECFGK